MRVTAFSSVHRAVVISFISMVSAILPCGVSAEPPAGYELIFSDEFDGKLLDRDRWDTRYHNTEWGAGIVDKDCARLDKDGHLVLTTKLVSGEIRFPIVGTHNSFLRKFGYWEARIRFQKSSGHHGAFWLMSPRYGEIEDNPAASGAEIDIVEYFGPVHDGIAHNIYWNAYKKKEKLRSDQSGPIPLKAPSDQFHTYALLWTPKAYVFFADGKETWRTEKGISETEQYIKLSLICDEWEEKYLELNRLPESMWVDYVRVYRKISQPNERQNHVSTSP